MNKTHNRVMTVTGYIATWITTQRHIRQIVWQQRTWIIANEFINETHNSDITVKGQIAERTTT